MTARHRAAPARHHQALRQPGGQRRHLAGPGARRGAGAAGRERRRQEHAGVDPVRPLCRRRRLDRSLRPAAAAGPAEGRAGGRHRHGAPALHAGRQPERAGQRDARHRAVVAAVLAPCRGARQAGANRPALRPGRGPGCAHRRPVGGRAPAGRDPQGPGARRAHPDPGRTHRGADAHRGGVAVRHAAPADRAGPVGDLHQPQARRGAARVAAHRHPARRQADRGAAGRGCRQGHAGRDHGRAPGADAATPAARAGSHRVQSAGSQRDVCRRPPLARRREPGSARR